MKSGLPEVSRSDLRPLRFGILEDTTTGAFYRSRAGLDESDVAAATAFFVDADGGAVLLELTCSPPELTG